MYTKEQRHNYYLKHRDKLLTAAKNRYCRKTEHKCIICGIGLDPEINGHFRYCDTCVKDKYKVSRQARWYRANRKKEQLKRRKK